MGAEVRAALDPYTKKMGGYRIGYYPLPNYDAASTDYLLTDPSVFYESIDSGVSDAVQFFQARQGCPTEHYVLAGFSQGAMVMHRALFEIESNKVFDRSADTLLPRVDGVLLLADGDRVDSEGGNHYGTASFGRASFGVVWQVLGSDGSSYQPVDRRVPNLPQWPSSRFHSVCMFDDMVCDYPNALGGGVAGLATIGNAVHSYSYHPKRKEGSNPLGKRYSGTAMKYITSAAEAIARTSRTTPPRPPGPSIITSSLPPGQVGAPYSAQLASEGGIAPLAWSEATGLSNIGLSLDKNTGIISGTPKFAVSGGAPIAVTLTDAAGQTATTTLTLVVTYPTTPGETTPGAGGIAVAWGLSDNGQLGDGTRTDWSQPTVWSLPVAVNAGGVLAGKTVTQVDAGDQHSCAVTSDGGVYCWGSNIKGQVGANSANMIDLLSPVAVDTSGVLAGKSVTQVSAGGLHTCAVTSDGGAYCWGFNSSGQLGDGSLTDQNSPVAVGGGLAGKTVTQVSAGLDHSCAVTSDGSAYCWGANYYGGLGGDGGALPGAVDTSGALYGKLVSQISAGEYRTCAVTSDGGAYCWGNYGFGALGVGVTSHQYSAVGVNVSGVLSGKSVSQISTGGSHTCAVTSDGGVYCWGSNGFGELGDGGTTDSSHPVAPDTSGVLAGKKVVQVASGIHHTCAVTTDGGAYCWGTSGYGELGDGSTTGRSLLPVAVRALGVLYGKRVIQVSAGWAHTLAVAG